MLISRRHFCALAATGMAAARTDLLAAEAGSEPLRVIAYNVFGCTGWPHQRELAKRAVAAGEMTKLLATELALHKPDIINLSEAANEQRVAEIAEHLEMHHAFFPSGDKWPGALLSRFKIVASENVPLGEPRPKELFTRHWGRGTLELPGGERLVVHSAHLFPGADQGIRLREIRAMIKSMKAGLGEGQSMLLMGDFNHGPDAAEYQLWIDAGWVDTFAKVGQGSGFTIRSDIPRGRIDYVMAQGPLAERISQSKPLFQGEFRLNINDPTSFALSDHLPQLAVFKAAIEK